MVKRLMYSVFVFVLVSSAVFAGGWDVERTGGFARVVSLGSNPYVMDPYYVTLNPAWGSVYDDMVWGDIGSSSGAGKDQFVVANFRLADNMTIGGILTQSGWNGSSIAKLDPLAGIPDPYSSTSGSNLGVGLGLDNNIQLMTTMDFDDLILGLGVAYASSTNETPSRDVDTMLVSETSASQIGFNFGALLRLNRDIRIDAGVSLILPSLTNTPARQREISRDQTIFSANLRGFWDVSDVVTLVPAVNFVTASGQDKDNNMVAPSPMERDLTSITSFTVGMGMQYRTGDLLLVGGPAFNVTSITDPAVNVVNGRPEQTLTVTSFPVWNLGAEFLLTEWLTGRLGYQSTTSKMSQEEAWSNYTTPGYQTVEYISTIYTVPGLATGVTAGIGLHFDGFWLDGVVSADVLRAGLKNIGGSADTFAYLSGGYAF